jgi:hypothetical protein
MDDKNIRLRNMIKDHSNSRILLNPKSGLDSPIAIRRKPKRSK